MHREIILNFEGKQTPLSFRFSTERNFSVVYSDVKFPTQFPVINKRTKPIKLPFRWYHKHERNFIEKTT